MDISYNKEQYKSNKLYQNKPLLYETECSNFAGIRRQKIFLLLTKPDNYKFKPAKPTQISVYGKL